MAKANGSARRLLVRLAFPYEDWSPDGTRLAFTAETFSEDPPHSAIRLITVSTGAQQVLTTAPDPATVAHPVFSPDGRSVVFGTGEEPGPSGEGIWIINVDGSGLRRLTGPGADPAWQRLR